MTFTFKHFVHLGFVILASYFLFGSSTVSAAGWDPGNIIDDVVFTNTTTMDVNSIQNFLNSKVPVCDTNHARTSSSNDSGPPYTCLKNYNENGKSSAQIIFDTAHKYQINPQVLIVLLQKEQALVTDTWPWAIQYKTATGYGCPDTAPCDSQYYGLTNQLDWAAKMFRAILNASPDWYTPYVMGNNFIQYNHQGSCGGTNVYIKNRPTQALYNYTPYQPTQEALAAGYGSAPPCGAYGNRNFSLYFNDWFGNTHAASKWLRKDPSGQVWLVTEGELPNGTYAKKKFKLTSWDIIVAYSLQYEQVVPVSYEYLTQYLDDGILSTRAISKNYSQIQFVNNGQRYYINSLQQCESWGFNCFDTNFTKTIPGTDFLERIPGMAKTIPPVMDFNNRVYKLQSGNKLPLLDAKTFADLGYSWDNVLYNTQSINASQSVGQLQISHQAVVQFNSSSPVVIYNPEAATFHSVSNYETFNAWGMQNYANLQPVGSSYTTAPPPTATPALSIWASDDTGRKYLVDQGRKIDVSTSTDMPAVSWLTVGKYRLESLPTATYGKYIQVQETGSVYALEAGLKRPVPNWDNFTGLRLSIPQLLPLSSYSASHFPTGPFKLADGRTFEDESGVWMINGQEKFHVPLWSYFSHFSIDPNKRITGQTNLSQAYSGTSKLSVLVKDTENNLYVVTNGARIKIEPSILPTWGLSSNSFIAMSHEVLAKLPISGSLNKFAYSEKDGLFYGENGQKHHIDSYKTYQNLGGTPSNTYTLENDFFAASSTGNSLP